MTDLTGSQISQYAVVKELYHGPNAEVYLANDSIRNHHVVLKVFRANADHPEAGQRMLQESKYVCALNHPRICRTYEAALLPDGRAYLVLELIEGEELGSRIHPSAKPDDWIKIAIQIAEALNAAHKNHIFHRSLSLSRIRITPGGQVKVMDFGLKEIYYLADDSQDLIILRQTNPARAIENISYKTPEELRGMVVDARSNIFSLGVILYQMATGSHPFYVEQLTGIISRILQTQPEPASKLNPHVPSRISEIIQRCLEKDPERRYQSMDEVLLEMASLPS